MIEPLVTCIMPTIAGRPQFQPSAIDCFLAQTYANRQLLIVSEDDPSPEHKALIMADNRVRYALIPKPTTLGEKRNVACTLADGELIAFWDDDDWSAPDRLAVEVAFMQEKRLSAVGLNECWFWDVRDDTAWRFTSAAPWMPVCASMVFKRSWWIDHQFPERNVGEDHGFSMELGPTRCRAFPGLSLMVCRDHDSNISKRKQVHDGEQVRRANREDIPPQFWY